MNGAGSDVFGATTGDSDRIVVALRAVATRHDIELGQVNADDAAAAAAAATLWCVVTGINRFSDVPLASPAAVAALSRILLRAAGSPVVPSLSPVSCAASPSDQVLLAAELAAGVLANSADPAAAAASAASDLAAGGEALGSAAVVLLEALSASR